MNGCAQPGDMFMAQTRKWWVDRPDRQFEAATLQGQHLRIAKCLRNDRIAGVKITKFHCGKRILETGKKRTAAWRLYRTLLNPKSAIQIRKTERPCRDPSQSPTRANPPCSA